MAIFQDSLYFTFLSCSFFPFGFITVLCGEPCLSCTLVPLHFHLSFSSHHCTSTYPVYLSWHTIPHTLALNTVTYRQFIVCSLHFPLCHSIALIYFCISLLALQFPLHLRIVSLVTHTVAHLSEALHVFLLCTA